MSKEEYRPQPSRSELAQELERRLEEIRSRSEDRFLEELRTIAETDPSLFATRAMGAFEELLKVRVPHAERERDRLAEERRAYRASAGYTRETLLPHARVIHDLRQDGLNEGYIQGVNAVWGFLRGRITGYDKGLPQRPQPPGKGKPQEQSPEGEGKPKP